MEWLGVSPAATAIGKVLVLEHLAAVKAFSSPPAHVRITA